MAAQVHHVRQFAFQVDRALLNHGCGLDLAIKYLELAGAYLVLFGSGLDAAICDVMDLDLVNAGRTADLVMNKEIYADSCIKS